MKRPNVLLLIVYSAFITNAYAQIANLNPDPEGEPWITGGVPELTSEMQLKINQIPNLTLQSTLDTPDSVDNSQQIYMRPIFNQGTHGSCAQASGIGI